MKEILWILIILFPYGALFVKGISFSVKLLFVSIIALAILGIMGIVLFLSGNSGLIAFMFSYNIFVWMCIFINFIFIVLIWLIK
jgi:hypothetical protein